MKRIADYDFDGVLAEGNHGTFHLARPPTRLGVDDEVVAVKVLVDWASDAELKRMANELRCLVAVRSPHLVEILDAGSEEGRLFYACRWPGLGTLEAPPPGEGPGREIGRGHRVMALADAAEAAHALHEAGVAHRDIKPANVWLTAAGGRLADLGLAQLLHPGRTATGIGPVGALEYLSPELVRGAEAGRASDCWAIGVTLHRVLSGRSIYPELPSASLLDALRHLLGSAPQLDQGLDEAERALVGRCLAAEPADRPVTAAELARSIRELAT